MNPLFQFTLAVALSMLIIPLVRGFAPRLGLVDMPDPRKVHSVPIPRVGGWGITLGLLLPLLLVFGSDRLVQAYAAGCLLLFGFGVWDDARTIGHWPKFVGQLLAVAAVVYGADLWVARIPFYDGALPPEAGKPFTVFAMIGVINAINHSDGLDGLAGGESILSLMAIALLGYVSDSPLVVCVALATIGGILGFLRYNSHPAYVFMGDSGSQVLGFTLGFLVVLLTQRANTAISAALPLLLLGMPVADIISVLLQRVRGGMNWFRATRNHVHHRLLDLGFDHYETVVIIYSIQAVLVVSAVLARFESDASVTLIYLSVIALLFTTLTVAERRGWRLARAGGTESRLTHAIAALRRSNLLVEGALLTITILAPAVMLLSALWVARIPSDFSAAAAVLALVPASQLLWPRAPRPAFLRLAIYATAMLPAYLLISNPDVLARGPQLLGIALIAVLALAIVVYVMFASDQRFGTTPTDYLVVCGLVALMVWGSIQSSSHSVIEAALLATVLMYACEIIVGNAAEAPNRRTLQYSTLGALLIIALRGVL